MHAAGNTLAFASQTGYKEREADLKLYDLSTADNALKQETHCELGFYDTGFGLYVDEVHNLVWHSVCILFSSLSNRLMLTGGSQNQSIYS